MKCPIDQSSLVMAERQGVEVDYCPQCRGVWLDRGELDKILDRAAERESPRSAPVRAGERTYRDSDQQRHGYSKRHSWLSELFD